MKIPAFRIASVIGLIISSCASSGLRGSGVDPELQEIAGYRQWHKLTEKPIVVEWSVPSG
jgi:hypothetical protein